MAGEPGHPNSLTTSESVGEAIADTGPILHLHEVGSTSALALFSRLLIPDLVLSELRVRGIDLAAGLPGLDSSAIEAITPPQQTLPDDVALLQPADQQVFAVAESRSFGVVSLTDDLALRHALETRGAVVVGSVGILVRGYTLGRLTRDALHLGIEALLERSTLHLSLPFRSYVRQMIASLP
jgi:hypothetical protein